MKPVKPLEWLVPAAAAICLFVSTCIVSRLRPMWLDEVLTYYAVAHDSAGDFIQSYITIVNTTPPLYFSVAWAAMKLVPLSVLSLRLFSSLACGVALLLIWATLRKHTSFFVSSAATFTAFLTSELFLFHNAEARFYGFYLALVAWAVYQYDLICDEASPSTRRLLWNTLSHALAVSCTYVAVFYSFAILTALLIRDGISRVWRPKVYLSVMAGWIPVFLYLPLAWAHRGATGWMPKPGAEALVNPMNPGYHTYFVLCAFAGLAAVTFLSQRMQGAEQSSPDDRSPSFAERAPHLMILAFLFLAVPYGLLLVTWAVLPLLEDRYALPSVLGVALLAAFVCAGLFGDRAERKVHRVEMLLRASLLALLLVYPLVKAFRGAKTVAGPPPLQGRFTEDAPVIATTDPHSYFPLYFQSGDNHRIYLVVRDVTTREMWERFNKRLNPILVDDFLAKHERFQLLSNDVAREWLEQELRSRGGFTIKAELASENGKTLTVKRQ